MFYKNFSKSFIYVLKDQGRIGEPKAVRAIACNCFSLFIFCSLRYSAIKILEKKVFIIHERKNLKHCSLLVNFS